MVFRIMRKLVIGFSTPKKFRWTSWLIRKFQRSEYSHIYIVMKASPKSRLAFDKVFQASHGDVNAITLENFEDGNKIIHTYEICISDDTYFEVANWLWRQLGKPYGFMQLLAIAVGMNKDSNKNNAYICSELAGRVLKDFLGYDINKKMDTIGLTDIHKVLEESKDAISENQC